MLSVWIPQTHDQSCSLTRAAFLCSDRTTAKDWRPIKHHLINNQGRRSAESYIQTQPINTLTKNLWHTDNKIKLPGAIKDMPTQYWIHN
jgi:hypothetical protein